MAASLSFKTRIVLLVLFVALVPLGFAGVWLAWGTTRSGEELLQERLQDALEETVAHLASNWVEQRGRILGLAEDRGLRDALSGTATPFVPPGTFSEQFQNLSLLVHSAVVFDLEGKELWSLYQPTGGGSAQGTSGLGAASREALSIRYRMPVFEGLSDLRLGVVEVTVGHEALLPLGSIPPEAAGMVIGLFDPVGERSVRPVPFDPQLLEDAEFRWGGDRWVTSRRNLREPPVTVVLALPASPLLGPFKAAARQGTLLLLMVGIVGFLAAVAISRRLTRGLETLSEAAQAVSNGDFRRRIDEEGEDEVGRVAGAFNVMTESLEQTLEELARKESLAAVGEFAASLAHEIRNPLTAVRIDLQRALADLPADSGMRDPLQRSLDEIDGLNLTIDETLFHARIGRAGVEAVDVWDVLRSGAEAAQPFFQERGASLILETGGSPLLVQGDADTLRQAFLNLFRNAAEALGPGGEARIEVMDEEGMTQITVTDTGSGIPEELQDRVFEPLFTTRSAGTGLGLTIVKRIVEAHRGEVALESAPGLGTQVRVRLPKM